ncbi:unnamed protein product [Darwinula stevensoni]|uniref:AIG1-type G domain-containing protein n=1 Tax=Darwinula stevensoni TaxID=69355 RepID=A0A7R8X217_9CRUS|nr:unnamed protein product [Darwinula stevensoni]CAG0882779.1 unnamed protein product [Darwinula stevensoni]
MMEENKEILHEALKRGSVEVLGENLPNYPLPFKLIKTDQFSLGEIEKRGICLNVILLGLTGTGKSRLLEVIGNYGLGVDYWDPYRFQVKKDEHTEKITSYTFSTRYENRLPLPVTIIDTPGFLNATAEDDRKLMGDIRNFIHSNQMPIHAVAYVIPASQGRLTAEQKTVLWNMPKALGEDEERIKRISYLFCTFADSKLLPVLESVKEAGLRYKTHFAVNSAAYFVDEKVLSIEENKENREKSINELLWTMTTESVREFLEDIQCNWPFQVNLPIKALKPQTGDTKEYMNTAPARAPTAGAKLSISIGKF